MAKVKTTAPRTDIRKIVRQIVERFHPQKIILFGSHAYGQPTPDSDVDLLVLLDTEENTLHAAARISASLDHEFPLDILVFTPSDWNAYLLEKAVFATQVAAKGLVVHETRNSGMD